MTQEITIELPDQMYSLLESERRKYAYPNVEDVVLDALREHFFIVKKDKTTKSGKSKKISADKIVSNSSPFSFRGGSKVDV